MAKGSVRKKGKKWYYRFYVAVSYTHLQCSYSPLDSELLKQAANSFCFGSIAATNCPVSFLPH